MIVKRRGGAVLRQLQTLYNVGTIGKLTDGQLLERFATDADEVAELAFSALVERHEVMVWRVCLAIVRDEHQAEDAFQATFLVLVRKARSLYVRDSVGPWLYQVACRTAACVRRTAVRRHKHEQCRAARDAARSLEMGPPRDLELHAAVHEEVNHLPEKYRAPVVLCDLEGRTHEEAARFLGWPIGTVKSRQSQGRGLIRDRLLRRGLGLAAAGAIVGSLRQTAVAAMPIEISRRTVRAAMQISARLVMGFGISARVLTITEEVLRAMLLTRLPFFAAASVAMCLAFGGASVYVRGSQEPAAKHGPPVATPSPTGPAHSPQARIAPEPTPQPPADAPALRLREQQLATRKAKASYEIARFTRELAEIAVEEYEGVTFPRDLATVDAEIKLAQSDLRRAEDRLDWARKMFDKGYVPISGKISEELAHKKAVFSVEQTQSKKKVLVGYTRGKTVKELKTEVEMARSNEMAKQIVLEMEQLKEIEVELQLRTTKNGAGRPS